MYSSLITGPGAPFRHKRLPYRRHEVARRSDGMRPAERSRRCAGVCCARVRRSGREPARAAADLSRPELQAVAPIVVMIRRQTWLPEGAMHSSPSNDFGVRELTAADLTQLRQLNTLFGVAFHDPETYCSQPPGDDYVRALLADRKIIVLAAL